VSARLKSGLIPYLLSLPTALWLGAFFVVPLAAILALALMTGNSIDGWTLTWNFGIFGDAVSTYSTQFGRSFLYGGISTAVALLTMYPVAYWIAFHGGRFKSVLLFLLLLPFFVSFVIRIIAWQFILADNGSNWYISGESNKGWSAYMDDLLAGLRQVHGSDFEVVDTGPVSTRGL